jgi:hypothetical protein
MNANARKSVELTCGAAKPEPYDYCRDSFRKLAAAAADINALEISEAEKTLLMKMNANARKSVELTCGAAKAVVKESGLACKGVDGKPLVFGKISVDGAKLDISLPGTGEYMGGTVNFFAKASSTGLVYESSDSAYFWLSFSSPVEKVKNGGKFSDSLIVIYSSAEGASYPMSCVIKANGN